MQYCGVVGTLSGWVNKWDVVLVNACDCVYDLFVTTVIRDNKCHMWSLLDLVVFNL